MSQGGLPSYGPTPHMGPDGNFGTGELVTSPNPGGLLSYEYGGRYRLSGAAQRLLRPIFDRLGYDLTRAQVRFSYAVARADTFRNSITINPEVWQQGNKLGRLRILGHEVTHSVQYQRLGVARFHLRLGMDRLRNGFDEEALYHVNDTLGDIRLPQFNAVDPRFTLESLATHAEEFVRSVP